MSTPVEPYPWLPIADVLSWIGASTTSPAIERARRAAGAYCESQRRDLVTAEGFAATDGVVMAGLLAAARLASRKGAPAGIAAYGEFATSILSYDPDVERQLGVGRYAKPEVG